jgi:predicted metalloprotease with PDZ domain
MAEKRPGDLLNLTIFRFDDLSTLLIKLGSRTDGPYRLVPVANPSELQRKTYRSWLG